MTPIPGRLAALEHHGVRDEVVTIPGTADATTVKGIVLKVVIDGGSRVTLMHTFHAVAVDGAWRWYLPAPRLATYAAGGCPGVTAAPPPALAA
jgi:hypothetical protein